MKLRSLQANSFDLCTNCREIPMQAQLDLQ